MKFSHVLLVLTVLPLLISCGEDDVIQALPSRYVYFVDDEGALKRYDITLKKTENLQLPQVTRMTRVAANGIVLFETAPGTTTRLHGLCQDGSLIPVPMPVAPNASEEYFYGESGASLSREGHHAAWAVYRRPNGESDSTVWTQEICRFDCGAWSMQQVDVTAFVRAQFEGTAFTPDIVVVNDVLISDNGDNVVLGVVLTDLRAGGTRETQSLILRMRDGELSMLQGTRHPVHLLSFDPGCTSLYYETGGKYYAMTCEAGGVTGMVFSTSHPEMLRPAAFAQTTGEYVASVNSNELLSLVQAVTMEKTVVVATIRDITAYYPEISYGELRHWAAVSPDAQWVTFVWISEDSEHLCIVRRNGEGLLRIAKGSFPVAGVISDEIPLQ